MTPVLAANDVLRDAFTASERVHVIGLVSDGGVHSSLDHLRALIGLARQLEVPDLVIHAFTDGRDTLPKSGEGFLTEVEAWTREAGVGRIGSRWLFGGCVAFASIDGPFSALRLPAL